MGRHLFLTLLLILFFGFQSSVSASVQYSVFPLCSASEFHQSDRLNHFHKLMFDLSYELQLKMIKPLPEAGDLSKCESARRRSIAAMNNMEAFIQGSYTITGDSVLVSMQMVSTLFVDKSVNLDVIHGNIHRFNELITTMALSALRVFSVVTDSIQYKQIAGYVENDEQNYILTSSNTTNAKLELGKISYDLGNYAKTVDLLLQIEPGDKNYGEAQFILGKCQLLSNDFHKSLVLFKAAKKAGCLVPELNDYIYHAENLNKPAHWFDTEYKRKEWWESLTSEEVWQILHLLNNLNINSKKYLPDYQYIDSDIKALFNIEILPLSGMKCRDLNLFRPFTGVTFLILDDCKLESGSGIQFLNHLKMVKSKKGALLKLPEIQEFIERKGLIALAY